MFDTFNVILFLVFGFLCIKIWEKLFGTNDSVNHEPPRAMSKDEKAEAERQYLEAMKVVRKQQRKDFVLTIYGLIQYLGSVVWLFFFLFLGKEFSSWSDFFFILVGIVPSAYLLMNSGNGPEQNYPDDGSDSGGM